jgi:hypothetical protein
MRTAILALLLAMPLVVPLWGARVRGARAGLRRTLLWYFLFNVLYVATLMIMDETKI